MISLLTVIRNPIEGWPTQADLFELAHEARTSLCTRALRIVQQYVDLAGWTEDQATLHFFTLIRLAFATTAVEGPEAGMLVFGRAAHIAPRNGWAPALVEAVMSRGYYENGERIAARVRLNSAIGLLAGLDPQTVYPDAWLSLADAAVPFDVALARDAIRYSETTRALSYDEPTTRMFGILERGRLAEALGARDDAEIHYRNAWQTARDNGDVRGAIAVAARLGALTDDAQAWSYVREHAHRCHPTWWPISLADARERRNEPRLTPAQREVFARICAGESNKAIAIATGRSVSRVRDIVAELFVVFGVERRTRAALVATANGHDRVRASGETA
ncbi:MAG TPA: hypothetical protein VN224_02535 [Xanthomonadales bacterium]|nr:hypothetical protein [Xanthomonadales bacterium]